LQPTGLKKQTAVGGATAVGVYESYAGDALSVD